MRFPIDLIRSRHLSRVAVVALLAGLAASCSDSTTRFSSDPFSNPFRSGAEQVAYAQPQRAAVAQRPRYQDNYSAGGYGDMAAAPVGSVSSQPLPPVGAVSQRSVPQREYRINRGDQPIVTGAISTPEPQIGGFKAGGWSATGGTPVTVAAGEDVNTLSNRYGVPSDAIMKVNGLSSRALSPGRQIIIPVYNAARTSEFTPDAVTSVKTTRVMAEQPYPADVPPQEIRGSVGEVKIRPVATTPAAEVRQRVAAAEPLGMHVVKPGETLTSIAQAYATTRPRLAKANGLDEWATVKIGQQLKISAPVQKVAAPVAAPAARSVAERTKEFVDSRPPADVPMERPNASAIARVERAPPAKAQALAEAKAKVIKPATSKPLQTAAVKAKPDQIATPKSKPIREKTQQLAAAKPAEAGKAAKLKADKVATAKPKAPATKAAQVAQAKLPKVPEPMPQQGPSNTASIPSAQVAVQQSAPAKSADNGNPEFRWPVKGRIIQGFGQNSDGINISVPEGTEVKAAEDGVVAYAGSELKGYGNLILIRHPNGYVTAYGHAKELDVKKGDTVRRGETIATAGQTGNVNSPQVLFEVRKGAAPVDPTRYLSGS